jgi:hypothetical protein
VHFKANPYVWTDTAKDVTSPVMQVQLKRTDADIVDDAFSPPNLTQFLRIVIPQERVEVEQKTVTLSPTIKEYFVAFNKTSNASKLALNIGAVATPLMLNVTIYSRNVSEGDIDNMEEFINISTLSNASSTVIYNHVFLQG